MEKSGLDQKQESQFLPVTLVILFSAAALAWISHDWVNYLVHNTGFIGNILFASLGILFIRRFSTRFWLSYFVYWFSLCHIGQYLYTILNSMWMGSGELTAWVGSGWIGWIACFFFLGIGFVLMWFLLVKELPKLLRSFPIKEYKSFLPVYLITFFLLFTWVSIPYFYWVMGFDLQTRMWFGAIFSAVILVAIIFRAIRWYQKKK